LNEDKASRFHRLRRRTAILAAVWSALLLALLLATGWSALLRDAAHRSVVWLFGSSLLLVPAVAVCYALVLALVHEVVAFPLAFFSGFYLERLYGLSKQSVGDWFQDHLKAFSLGLLFGGASAGFVYLALSLWPDEWWLAATAGAIVVGVVLTWLAPVVLIPLFFKMTPLRNDPLRQRLDALADRSGTGALDIFEWRLSDKTSRANAALTGFGKTRRILLSDTLIADYSADEIEVVLAHEMSHHVRHDVWRALALEAVVVGAGFWASSHVLPRAIGWLGLGGLSDVAGLPVLVLTAMVVSTVALPAANAISRWHERRADRFALDITRNPTAFASAMKRLGASNLAEDDPSLFARLFFYSHPPMADRLAFARAWVAKQQPR
jgi:STE24 endopeptidase